MLYIFGIWTLYKGCISLSLPKCPNLCSMRGIMKPFKTKWLEQNHTRSSLKYAERTKHRSNKTKHHQTEQKSLPQNKWDSCWERGCLTGWVRGTHGPCPIISNKRPGLQVPLPRLSLRAPFFPSLPLPFSFFSPCLCLKGLYFTQNKKQNKKNLFESSFFFFFNIFGVSCLHFYFCLDASVNSTSKVSTICEHWCLFSTHIVNEGAK